MKNAETFSLLPQNLFSVFLMKWNAVEEASLKCCLILMSSHFIKLSRVLVRLNNFLLVCMFYQMPIYWIFFVPTKGNIPELSAFCH